MSSADCRGNVAGGKALDYNNNAPRPTRQKPAADPTIEAVNAVSNLLRRASTTDHPRRVLVKAKSKAEAMNKATPAISLEEYETLPVSIQRKYFSSEERFQIAQRAAAEKRQRQSTNKNDRPTLKPQASCDFSKKRKTIKKANLKDQRRSSLPLVFHEEAVKGEAAWFESLPEKVRRSQFDHQERTAFSRTAPLDRPLTSSGTKPDFGHFSWDKQRSASAETPRMPQSPSTTNASLHSPSPSVATSRSYESSTSYPRNTTQRLAIPKTKKSERERLASRRNFLLHPIPLPPPILAPVSYLPSPDTNEYIQTSQFSPIIVRLDKCADSDATPTQEHAKDMMNNLPPSWYDEKLDFGFETRESSVSTCGSWEQPRTLSPSISDTASSHGPMTPISPALHAFDLKTEHQHTLQHIAEQNSSVTNFSHLQAQRLHDEVKPRRDSPKHLVDGFFKGQPTKQPYSVTVRYDNHDPLALESLSVCDDMSGSNGAFALNSDNSTTGFRKVLKVIRGH